MTLDELESSWSTVHPPASVDGISGKRAVGLPHNRPAYLAVDGQGRRHLLIQVPDDTLPVSQRDTKSLEVTTARFQVASNPEALYIDLISIDSSQHATFCAVAQDLLRSLRSSPAPLRDSIVDAIARWRAFWSAKAGEMSREDALGLFGELWLMRRWLAPVSATIIGRWQATKAARHDFQWPAASVEVKTAATRTAGEPVHKIASLEQLADPEQGQLYLFSLQVCDDALAMNTLHALVEGLAAEVQSDFQALTMLNEKLAARNYSPDDRQTSARPLRILAERLYRIGDGFPRIVRTTFQPAGLPQGVLEVDYTIDLSACRQWLVASAPTDAGATNIR